ncbi:MAG: hypothetical protein MJD61_04025 [Proteobacteria bacterium]|nr:hypothetical protein [Pseudomonadota bacterium]
MRETIILVAYLLIAGAGAATVLVPALGQDVPSFEAATQAPGVDTAKPAPKPAASRRLQQPAGGLKAQPAKP